MRRFISRDGGPEAAHHGAGDDRVADVELDDLRDRRDRLDVVVVEPVARVHDEPGRASRAAPHPRAASSSRPRSAPCGLCVGTRVQLDDRRAGARRRVDLGRVRVDEQRDADPAGGESAAGVGDRSLLSRDVEPALGRQLGRASPAPGRRPPAAPRARSGSSPGSPRSRGSCASAARRAGRARRGPGCAGDPRAGAA